MSSSDYKLSLPTAILININIMLGSGIFINTTNLAYRAGALGAFGYLIVSILMLPLVFSIAKLLHKYPEGGFYSFARYEINTFAGFLSAWSYFVSKLASSTLIIHIAVLLIQKLFPVLYQIPALGIDIAILALFIGLNMLNIKTGSAIQAAFMGLKLVPIFFAVFVGIFLFSGANFSGSDLIWQGLPGILPLVLYAMLGFEAACSISTKIHDAKKNGPRAIFISYAIVTITLMLYQLIFYGVVGKGLGYLPDFRSAFPAFIQNLHVTRNFGNILVGILHCAIAASALGGSYGIIFSNNWNLYILAQHKHTFLPHWFTQLNKHAIPWLCVMAEGFIGVLYFIVTGGRQVPLQQIGALGSAITYLLSALALVFLEWRHAHEFKLSISLLGVVNCVILIMMCIYSLVTHGAHSLLLFAGLIIFGLFMYWFTKDQDHQGQKLT